MRLDSFDNGGGGKVELFFIEHFRLNV